MHEIQSSEAKTHLPQLLDAVERGESYIITRHGKPIARLVPESAQEHKQHMAQWKEELEAFRKTMPKLTLEEILSARHEGHKY